MNRHWGAACDACRCNLDRGPVPNRLCSPSRKISCDNEAKFLSLNIQSRADGQQPLRDVRHDRSADTMARCASQQRWDLRRLHNVPTEFPAGLDPCFQFDTAHKLSQFSRFRWSVLWVVCGPLRSTSISEHSMCPRETHSGKLLSIRLKLDRAPQPPRSSGGSASSAWPWCTCLAPCRVC